MGSNVGGNISRREFGKRTGQLAAASALAGVAVPAVHAQGDSTIRLALVGCGGRGRGAVLDALRVPNVPSKLVAMADVFGDRLDASQKQLAGEADVGKRVDVPPERRFAGYDGYKHALDCLKPGDVAIFATPVAFRAPHFAYAIEKRLNVFMEKPLSADGATSRRLLKLGEQATAKNLKVGVGLMSRHATHLKELHQRVTDGAIGDIILMRGYRMHGPVAYFRSTPKPADISELDFQVKRFHSFLWSGGGAFSDYYIHIIDHLSWMKNGWPVKAQGTGGRHYKRAPDGTPYVDQNFDSYAIEYTFADGAKMTFDGRCMEGAHEQYASFLHGTKGSAVGAASGDFGGPSSIHKELSPGGANPLWKSTDNSNPYQNEWNALMDAIVNDRPYDETRRGVDASLATSMGRMAAHTGQEVTFDQMLNSDHVFAPDVDEMTEDSKAPLQPDKNGLYPVPEPGRKRREY